MEDSVAKVTGDGGDGLRGGGWCDGKYWPREKKKNRIGMV